MDASDKCQWDLLFPDPNTEVIGRVVTVGRNSLLKCEASFGVLLDGMEYLMIAKHINSRINSKSFAGGLGAGRCTPIPIGMNDPRPLPHELFNVHCVSSSENRSEQHSIIHITIEETSKASQYINFLRGDVIQYKRETFLKQYSKYLPPKKTESNSAPNTKESMISKEEQTISLHSLSGNNIEQTPSNHQARKEFGNANDSQLVKLDNEIASFIGRPSAITFGSFSSSSSTSSSGESENLSVNHDAEVNYNQERQLIEENETTKDVIDNIPTITNAPKSSPLLPSNDKLKSMFYLVSTQPDRTPLHFLPISNDISWRERCTSASRSVIFRLVNNTRFPLRLADGYDGNGYSLNDFNNKNLNKCFSLNHLTNNDDNISEPLLQSIRENISHLHNHQTASQDNLQPASHFLHERPAGLPLPSLCCEPPIRLLSPFGVPLSDGYWVRPPPLLLEPLEVREFAVQSNSFKALCTGVIRYLLPGSGPGGWGGLPTEAGPGGRITFTFDHSARSWTSRLGFILGQGEEQSVFKAEHEHHSTEGGLTCQVVHDDFHSCLAIVRVRERKVPPPLEILSASLVSQSLVLGASRYLETELPNLVVSVGDGDVGSLRGDVVTRFGTWHRDKATWVDAVTNHRLAFRGGLWKHRLNRKISKRDNFQRLCIPKDFASAVQGGSNLFLTTCEYLQSIRHRMKLKQISARNISAIKAARYIATAIEDSSLKSTSRDHADSYLSILDVTNLFRSRVRTVVAEKLENNIDDGGKVFIDHMHRLRKTKNSNSVSSNNINNISFLNFGGDSIEDAVVELSLGSSRKLVGDLRMLAGLNNPTTLDSSSEKSKVISKHIQELQKLSLTSFCHVVWRVGGEVFGTLLDPDANIFIRSSENLHSLSRSSMGSRIVPLYSYLDSVTRFVMMNKNVPCSAFIISSGLSKQGRAALIDAQRKYKDDVRDSHVNSIHSSPSKRPDALSLRTNAVSPPSPVLLSTSASKLNSDATSSSHAIRKQVTLPIVHEGENEDFLDMQNNCEAPPNPAGLHSSSQFNKHESLLLPNITADDNKDEADLGVKGTEEEDTTVHSVIQLFRVLNPEENSDSDYENRSSEFEDLTNDGNTISSPAKLNPASPISSEVYVEVVVSILKMAATALTPLISSRFLTSCVSYSSSLAVSPSFPNNANNSNNINKAGLFPNQSSLIHPKIWQSSSSIHNLPFISPQQHLRFQLAQQLAWSTSTIPQILQQSALANSGANQRAMSSSANHMNSKDLILSVASNISAHSHVIQQSTIESHKLLHSSTINATSSLPANPGFVSGVSSYSAVESNAASTNMILSSIPGYSCIPLQQFEGVQTSTAATKKKNTEELKSDIENLLRVENGLSSNTRMLPMLLQRAGHIFSKTQLQNNDTNNITGLQNGERSVNYSRIGDTSPSLSTSAPELDLDGCMKLILSFPSWFPESSRVLFVPHQHDDAEQANADHIDIESDIFDCSSSSSFKELNKINSSKNYKGCVTQQQKPFNIKRVFSNDEIQYLPIKGDEEDFNHISVSSRMQRNFDDNREHTVNNFENQTYLNDDHTVFPDISSKNTLQFFSAINFKEAVTCVRSNPLSDQSNTSEPQYDLLRERRTIAEDAKTLLFWTTRWAAIDLEALGKWDTVEEVVECVARVLFAFGLRESVVKIVHIRNKLKITLNQLKSIRSKNERKLLIQNKQ